MSSPLDPVRLARTRALLASGEARRIREAARVTQEELAQALGVSQAAVCRWEHGERVPSTESTVAIGRILTRLARSAA